MKILKIIFLSFTLSLLTGVVFAEESELAPPSQLQIYAINAGYKDEASAQNYDFIELRRVDADFSDLSLTGYSLVYFNSAGNEGGHIDFTEYQTLTGASLILGFTGSPQYADYADSLYVYNFGASGLASTAGKVQLLLDGAIIDELCWGKLECAVQNPKFSTSSADNRSLVRCVGAECTADFVQDLYYPLIVESVSIAAPPAPDTSSCAGLIISEILSYYVGDSAEQFVELYNTSRETINLSNCQLVYKNKTYPLKGELASFAYFVYQNPDLVLTKDPSSYNLYALSYASGDIFYEVVLPHGQKKGTSYAIFHPNSTDEQ